MHYSLIHANFNLQIYVMFNNILDAFEKLRNATIGFVMSVRMEHLGSHFEQFHEILYLRILRESFGKIQVTFKSDKNEGYFTWRPIYCFYHISLISS